MTGFRWNALRDWVKVARELPRTRGHYPDGPIVALVFAFCKAAEQAEPGTFDSVPVLRAILDATGSRRGRHLAFLIKEGDVVVLPDGRATLPNWRAFQEEGTSTKRVQKHRANKRDGVSGNGDETFQETPMERLAGAPSRRDEVSRLRRTSSHDDVRPSDDGRRSSERENSAHAPTDAFEVMLLVENLTRAGFDYREGHRIHDTLVADVENHGAAVLAERYRAFRATSPGPVDAAQLVFGVHNALHPLTRSKPQTDEQRKEAEIAAYVAAANARAAS